MWFFIASLLAVHVLSAVAAPTVGTDFLFAFPCVGSTANLFLFVVNGNNSPASLNIYSSDPNFDPMNQVIGAGSTQQIQFYDPDMQVCDSANSVAQKGIHIQSNQSVSVYIDIETTDGVGACNLLVLPTNMLGKQYAMNDQGYDILVAMQDNTQISFSGQTTTVTLNRLEAVRVRISGNITSNNAIAVIYSFTYYDDTSYSKDAIMALSSAYTASEFPIIAHPNVTDSTRVRVYAFEDHTYVLVNGLTQNQTNAGQYLDVLIQQPSVITTSRKAQVITGYINDKYQVAAQVVASNFYLTLSRAAFHPMTHVQYNSRDPVHTLVIITPLAGAGQISLDGTVIPALQYKRIPNSSYYYMLISVSSDQHVITTNSAGVKYTASVYSTYNGQSYANAKFNVGLDLPAAT